MAGGLMFRLAGKAMNTWAGKKVARKIAEHTIQKKASEIGATVSQVAPNLGNKIMEFGANVSRYRKMGSAVNKGTVNTWNNLNKNQGFMNKANSLINGKAGSNISSTISKVGKTLKQGKYQYYSAGDVWDTVKSVASGVKAGFGHSNLSKRDQKKLDKQYSGSKSYDVGKALSNASGIAKSAIGKIGGAVQKWNEFKNARNYSLVDTVRNIPTNVAYISNWGFSPDKSQGYTILRDANGKPIRKFGMKQKVYNANNFGTLANNIKSTALSGIQGFQAIQGIRDTIQNAGTR